jgi:hypothetical protein
VMESLRPTFFNVVDTPPATTSNNNCRQSHRKKIKRDLQHTLCIETEDVELIHLEGSTSTGVEKERTNIQTRHNGNEQKVGAVSITVQACTDEADDVIASNMLEESQPRDESEDLIYHY